MAKDGPAQSPAAGVIAKGLVAVESTAADDESGAAQIRDCPALDLASVGGVTDPDSLIVRQDVVDERQGTADVEDASPFGLEGQPIFNGQTSDGDSDGFLVLADIKDSALLVAAYGQQAGARPLDVQ